MAHIALGVSTLVRKASVTNVDDSGSLSSIWGKRILGTICCGCIRDWSRCNYVSFGSVCLWEAGRRSGRLDPNDLLPLRVFLTFRNNGSHSNAVRVFGNLRLFALKGRE